MQAQCTKETPDGFFLIADTAFLTRSPTLANKIRTPLKQGSRLPANQNKRVAAIRYSNRLTQARQAVEWGMRALQVVFSQLRVPLDINDRTRCVGFNQIRSVYGPEQNGEDAALRQQAYTLFFPRNQHHNRVGQFYLDDNV